MRGASVTWTTQARPVGVRFDADQYDAEVERAMSDFSWETPDRTAARLIRLGVDREALRRHGLRLCWASGRLAEHTMTIALEHTPGPYQLLLAVPWLGDDTTSIARQCIDVLASSPSRWARVRWIPQATGLGTPAIAGPGWEPGVAG